MDSQYSPETSEQPQNHKSQCSNIDTHTPSATSISLALAVRMQLSKVGTQI